MSLMGFASELASPRRTKRVGSVTEVAAGWSSLKPQLTQRRIVAPLLSSTTSRSSTWHCGQMAPAIKRRFVINFSSAVQPRTHRPILSSASTAAVSGRVPRHMANAAAACSTSIPRPSQAFAAPAFTAQAQNGVSTPRSGL